MQQWYFQTNGVQYVITSHPYITVQHTDRKVKRVGLQCMQMRLIDGAYLMP